MFEILKAKDIEEKIKLNVDKGFTLEKLRDSLQTELYYHERIILKIRFDFLKRRFYWPKSLLKLLLPYQIQAQNLKEQIDYIHKKMQETK